MIFRTRFRVLRSWYFKYSTVLGGHDTPYTVLFCVFIVLCTQHRILCVHDI